MSIRPIIQYGDPVLTAPATHLPTGAELATLVQDLLDTVAAHQGLGLAAPQIGVPARVLVAQVGAIMTPFIDTKIISQTGRVLAEEGCLSLPELRATVPRAEIIELYFRDAQGVVQTQSFSGWTARIIQHEHDHLDGVLYLDRINPIQRSQLVRKWQLNNRRQGR